MKCLAATLLLAAIVAGGEASAAEGLKLGGDVLNGTGTSGSDADAAKPGNLQADDDSYKKICDAFGEGFVYGSNGTCVKVGGYLKFGTSVGGAAR